MEITITIITNLHLNCISVLREKVGRNSDALHDFHVNGNQVIL